METGLRLIDTDKDILGMLECVRLTGGIEMYVEHDNVEIEHVGNVSYQITGEDETKTDGDGDDGNETYSDVASLDKTEERIEERVGERVEERVEDDGEGGVRYKPKFPIFDEKANPSKAEPVNGMKFSNPKQLKDFLTHYAVSKRVKQKALGEVETSLKEHHGKVWDYTGEILRSNPVKKDGNNHMFPIAWVVVEVESRSSWDWFIELVKQDLDITTDLGMTVLAYFGGQATCDAVENNMRKTFNGSIVEARSKSLIYMLEDIRLAVMVNQRKRNGASTSKGNQTGGSQISVDQTLGTSYMPQKLPLRRKESVPNGYGVYISPKSGNTILRFCISVYTFHFVTLQICAMQVKWTNAKA
ncbi:hypothetical protein LguiA_026137 [Lonicera macranthoides]